MNSNFKGVLKLKLEKLFQFLASLRLAVIVIISLGFISAIGTFVEAKYDAEYAQKIVYHSVYMYLILALLCVNLFNVMIDRLPWKRHHAGFIFAHIGIITLLLGSLVTKLYGIDGSVSIDIGKSNRFVMLSGADFSIYGSYGQDGYRLLAKTDRDFLVHPVDDKPLTVQLGQEELKIIDYYHYALRNESIKASEFPNGQPAIRINLQNANVNMTEWLLAVANEEQPVLALGPATITMTQSVPKYKGANEIYFQPNDKEPSKLNYYVFTKSKGGLTGKGQVSAGDLIELGWMGLQLRVLNYYPHSEKVVSFTDNQVPNARTQPAIKFAFRDKEHWLSLNSNLRIFNENSVYLVAYNNKRLNLGFDIHLDDFTVGRYQGTMRAATYASDVSIPGVLKYHISMNEPLKYAGYTFYQASFQEDETGKATTSILSVNKDPGRWIKYLGSFLIVFGSIVMFYFKRSQFNFFKKGA